MLLCLLVLLLLLLQHEILASLCHNLRLYVLLVLKLRIVRNWGSGIRLARILQSLLPFGPEVDRQSLEPRIWQPRMQSIQCQREGCQAFPTNAYMW